MRHNFIPIAKVKVSQEEVDAVVEVLRSGYLVQGEKTQKFEEEFANKVGARFAVAVSSGTAALHIAYLSLLEKGDDVLVPAFSHISTASMVCFAEAKPIFCDIDKNTFTLDLNDARRKLTKNTKAIVGVHLFGNACCINEIIEFARENNLKVIWDAAQAHGTKYNGKDVGSFDDIVCYSFYPTKNMFTGEGGMIVTNDENIYEKCKLLRSHGQTKKYYHPYLGFNYRMSEIEAALGIEQLAKLDDLINKRRENASFLTEELSSVYEIIPPFVPEEIEHSYHQYTVLIKKNKPDCTRDMLVEKLKREGIGVAIHYPRPLHKQPVFENLYGKITLPVSEDISSRIFSLPVHPYLDKDDLRTIVETIKALLS